MADKVICINIGYLGGNNAKPNLTFDAEYEVIEVDTCPEPCGEKHYNVGVKPNVYDVHCYKCRRKLPKSGGVHWANSVRFK